MHFPCYHLSEARTVKREVHDTTQFCGAAKYVYKVEEPSSSTLCFAGRKPDWVMKNATVCFLSFYDCGYIEKVLVTLS